MCPTGLMENSGKCLHLGRAMPASSRALLALSIQMLQDRCPQGMGLSRDVSEAILEICSVGKQLVRQLCEQEVSK